MESIFGYRTLSVVHLVLQLKLSDPHQHRRNQRDLTMIKRIILMISVLVLMRLPYDYFHDLCSAIVGHLLAIDIFYCRCCHYISMFGSRWNIDRLFDTETLQQFSYDYSIFETIKFTCGTQFTNCAQRLTVVLYDNSSSLAQKEPMLVEIKHM